jgi:hypothetical protein
VRHSKTRGKQEMGKNNYQKEKGIKIIDPKKIDYTFTNSDDLFDTKSDIKSNDSSKKLHTEKKDIGRIRHDITRGTKIRTKGRIAAGQSKQSHSSVYE